MRYVIRRRYFFRPAFGFENETGGLSYEASGTLLSWTYNLMDANGAAMLTIRKRPLPMGVKYEAVRYQNVVATITSEFDTRTWYRVEIAGETAMSIRPDLWNTNFDFLNSEGRLAVLKKPTLPFLNPTELTIFDERRKEIAVVATVAVLATHRGTGASLRHRLLSAGGNA